MIELLTEQYKLATGSRNVVLNFMENELGTKIILPLQEFNGISICYLLIHVVNTYRQWLGNFSLNKQLDFASESEFSSIAPIRNLFFKIDDLVSDFLKTFTGKMEDPIISTLNDQKLTLTPLQLFTHVLTHEFHHKGQMMSMCRLLGHIPIDTDIIRF